VRKAQAPPRDSVIPMSAPSLAGRDDDLARVEALLSDQASRLATLAGRGGVGKTRLALEVLRRRGPTRPRAVIFVDLSAVRRRDQALPEIAASLRLTANPDLELIDSVAAALTAASLLVLDNMEHLRGASDVTARIRLARTTARRGSAARSVRSKPRTPCCRSSRASPGRAVRSGAVLPSPSGA
jgi:Cdc6-like AAA superfamily ATPase